jgi:hypothetical protein
LGNASNASLPRVRIDILTTPIVHSICGVGPDRHRIELSNLLIDLLPIFLFVIVCILYFTCSTAIYDIVPGDTKSRDVSAVSAMFHFISAGSDLQVRDWSSIIITSIN